MPPSPITTPSGKLVGFDVEIGEEIAKRLGVKAEFLEGKWDGLIAGLDANRYDAVINQVGITEERKAKYDFSDPYIASKAVLIVRGDNADIKGFADLKGKKAAQSLTSNFGKIAEASGAELVGTDGFDQSIQLVLRAAPTPPSTTACPSSISRSSSRTRNVKIAATGGERRLFRRHRAQGRSGTGRGHQQGAGRRSRPTAPTRRSPTSISARTFRSNDHRPVPADGVPAAV